MSTSSRRAPSARAVRTDPGPRSVRALSRAVDLGLVVLAVVLNIGFYLPEVPAQPAPGVDVPGLDKVFHAGAFALTVWALGRVLAPQWLAMGVVALAALVHAVLIEALQGAALPHRSASTADVLADAAGIAAGVLVWALERRIRRPSQS